MKLILFFAFALTAFSCKKGKTEFTYVGKWTVAYDFATGTKVKGTFTATLKADGKWDYAEGASGKTDAGTWTSSGNNISFAFNFSGMAVYTGTKVSDKSLTGTAVADGGTSIGTWTATR
jgi:hypothetical protein